MKFWPPTANLPVKVLLIDTHIGYSTTKLNFDFLLAGSYFWDHRPGEKHESIWNFEMFYLYLNTNKSKEAKLSDHFTIFWPSLLDNKKMIYLMCVKVFGMNIEGDTKTLEYLSIKTQTKISNKVRGI